MSGFDQFPFGKIGIPFIALFLFFAFGKLGNTYAYSTESKTFRADPELRGPESLCIVFGGVIGTFSGGGNPDTDIYSWLVTTGSGEVLFDRTGGRQFNEIKVSFNSIGTFTVALSVRRGTEIIYESTLEGEVTKGPEIELLPDYLLCGTEPVELIAIDEDTPNLNQYSFIWRDGADNIVGDQNKFYTLAEGRYFVELFLSGSDGSQNCLITGNTYVGPSLDFEVTASAAQICEGQGIRLSTDTPISGEWFLQKPGATQKEDIGSAFSINLDRSDLTEPGIYSASFVAIDPLFPDCPSERSVTFEVSEAPKIELRKINKPRDCAEPTGIFSVNALSPIDSLVIPELNFSQINLSTGLETIFENLKPQIYTVSVYSNGCEFTTLMILEAEEPATSPSPPDQVEVKYTKGNETCDGFSVNSGWINLDFPEGNVLGEYRILALNSGTVSQGTIENQDSLRVDLPDGRYFFELKIEGCTYPVEEFEIRNQEQVDFSIPDQINICETFQFLPETSQNLAFTLTYPDGTEVNRNTGQTFTLTAAGEYILKARNRDNSSSDCPRQSTFTATLSQAIQYEVVLIEEDCFGNKVFEAQLQGININQASLRWLNEDGEIVGRNPIFYPTAIGKYSLVVQPLESGFCPVNPVEFEIEPPVLQVDVELTATKICPDPNFALVSLETDEDEVVSIEWIYYDTQNQRQDLDQFKDLFEIQVFEVGAYEAVVFNKLGCEIGRNFINVELSTLLDLPAIADKVAVCSKENTLPPLDPGEYVEYAWYFEENLISTSRLFKPKQVGNYTLFVTTVDGCEFSKQFETFEVCDFDVVYPNAMILFNPDKDFRVLVSEGVTEAELLIINRQGALIHRDLAIGFEPRAPILRWNGTSQGRKIPLGTYAVVLFLRNTEYGFNEKVTGSLLVLE